MRSLRAASALVLALVSALAITLGGAPARAAAGDGTLTVTLVDEHGDPMPGIIYLTSGPGFVNSQQGSATATFSQQPGTYAVFAMTAWGGMLCAGMATCDYFAVLGGTPELDGSVVVTAGKDTAVTLTGTEPVALTGPGKVGASLTVDYSPGMDRLLGYLGGVGGPSLAPGVTWLRDGTPIAGETSSTYVPRPTDAGKDLAARIAYTGLALAQFELVSGGKPVTPRTTNAIRVSKVATKTFAILSNPVVRAGRQGKVRVEVTATNQVVTGTVTATLGDWSQTRTLRNGTARFLLPALKPGRYAVGARYLGSPTYQASTAASRTLTVRR